MIWVNFWQNFFFESIKYLLGITGVHIFVIWLLSWNLFVWEFWSNRFLHHSTTTHIANIVLTAIKVESAPSHNYIYRIKYSENIPRTLLDLISHRSLYFGYFTMRTNVFFSSCFRKYLIAFSESSWRTCVQHWILVPCWNQTCMIHLRGEHGHSLTFIIMSNLVWKLSLVWPTCFTLQYIKFQVSFSFRSHSENSISDQRRIMTGWKTNFHKIISSIGLNERSILGYDTITPSFLCYK